jgi:hypothetical protein
MDSWKDKRKVWADARDTKFKVKKGAVAGVSVGDSIDKVYAASKKGYLPVLKALDALHKDLAKYVAKSGSSAAGLVGWIKGTLQKQVDDARQRATADSSMLQQLQKDVLEFHQLAVPGIPESDVYAKAVKLMHANNLTWPAAAKELNLYVRTKNSLPYWQKMQQRIAGLTFKMDLPEHDANYAFWPDLASRYQKGIGVLNKYLACKDNVEHLELYRSEKPVLEEVCSEAFWPEFTGHVKKLLG